MSGSVYAFRAVDGSLEAAKDRLKRRALVWAITVPASQHAVITRSLRSLATPEVCAKAQTGQTQR